MKLSIIYNISNLSDTLEKSLRSIKNIDDSSIEIIFIITNMENILSKIESLELKKINKVFCYVDKNHISSYSYNLGLRIAKGDYIYFSGTSSIFSKDIASTFKKIVSNEYDMIYFGVENKKAEHFIYDYFARNNLSIKNFFFRTDFLIKNKINFIEYKNLYSLFIFHALERLKKIKYLAAKLVSFLPKECYFYNLYDILESAEILNNELSKIKQVNFEKEEAYLAFIAVTVLYEFIRKVYISNYKNKSFLKSNHQIEMAITYANNLMNKINFNYKKNKLLLNNENYPLANYILKFKPNLKLIKDLLMKVEETNEK